MSSPQALLEKYERDYKEFRKLFEEDGVIDDQERVKLDAIQTIIDRIRGQLASQPSQENGETSTAAADAGKGAAATDDQQAASPVAWDPPTESKQPTLRKGDDTVDGWVEYMQKLANHHLGSGTVPESGKFDQKTFKGVIRFQKSTGCKVDGIVGNETWSVLREQKTRDKVGTDGRPKGSFVEKGPEARWGTESGDFTKYDEASDQLLMIAFSVGDEKADSYSATVRIRGANGVEKTFQEELGTPTGPSPTGAGHAHAVRIPNIRSTFGEGTHKVDAYLDKELGGDNWQGEIKTSGTTPPPPGQTGSIGFTVTEKVSDKPVSGATVSVAGKSAPTDSSGTVVFDDVAAGSYPYTVTASGFKSAKGGVEVEANMSKGEEVQLEATSTPPPGETGSIGFTVTEKVSDKPVSGATVSVAGKSAPTDSSGTVVFDDVAAGSYPYTVTASGFKSAKGGVEVEANMSKGEEVQLEATSTPPPGETGSIGFTVTETGTNRPVSGAKVSVAGESASTDSSGTVVFDDVAAGSYPYTVTASGFKSAKGGVEVEANMSKGEEVQLEATSAPPPGETGSIGFTVTETGTNRPVSGAKVSVAGESASTDSSGTVVFDDVAAGSYPYTVTASGFKSAKGGVEVEANMSKGEEVQLEATSAPPPGETGSIGFTVTETGTNRSVSGATVSVAGESASTDSSGTVVFDDVAAGSYPYSVTASGFKSAKGGVEVEANMNKGEEVQLEATSAPPPGETGSIGFTVTETGTNKPVSGAKVSVAGESASTDSSGTVVFDDVAAGSYPYRVSASGFRSAQGGVKVEANLSKTEEVQLERTTPPPPDTLGSISFVVTDTSTGKSISGANVIVAARSAATGSSGTVTVDKVKAGSYRYGVTADGYEASSDSVQVQAGQANTESVKLTPVKPEKPDEPKPPSGGGGTAPPDHTIVATKTFKHLVHLRDTNWLNEELGEWVLRMEVGITGTGQLYPLHVDYMAKLDDPANKIIKIFPTIKAKSMHNVSTGKRSCDITFTVQVAGPNVTKSDTTGIKLPFKIGWESRIGKVEAGIEASWDLMSSYTSQAEGAWSRRFVFTGADKLIFATQDSQYKEDIDEKVVIDDDHGHDGWGWDSDWYLESYDFLGIF